ncbi:MAG: hypothetical protein JO015_05205 [Verrucomicrobia bacterium]|nr:hypothetical protein [Verrucomicrobiota bacterium]
MNSRKKAAKADSREWKAPEIRDLTPEEEVQLDRMCEEIGRLVWGEKWPEARERARRLNGGRG